MSNDQLHHDILMSFECWIDSLEGKGVSFEGSEACFEADASSLDGVAKALPDMVTSRRSWLPFSGASSYGDQSYHTEDSM